MTPTKYGTKDNPWHPTHLEQYEYCPRKYLYGESSEPSYVSWWALRGTIIHEVFAKGFKSLPEVFWRNIQEQTKPIKKTPHMGFKEDEIADELVKLSLELPHYWRFLETFGVNVIERELTLDMKIDDVWDGRKREGYFKGTLDALAVHPDTPEGMVEIHDYKTGRKWGPEALNRKLQFGLYYLLAKENGYKVNRVFWCQTKHLVPLKSNSKTGAKKGEWKNKFLYPVKISDRDLPFILDRTFTIIKGIEAGIFPWAANGADAPCGMCEYASNVCPRYAVGNRGNDETMGLLTDSIIKEKVQRDKA